MDIWIYGYIYGYVNLADLPCSVFSTQSFGDP